MCETLLAHLREQATAFRFIDKEEEPPIRTLDHGIFGEGISAEVPPHPYMVRGRSGKWYHGYRCDMNTCDELCHATPQLRQIFGPEDSENAASFRLVMGYTVGSNTELLGTSPDIVAQLSEVLGPASTRVYSDTPISRIYSVYAIVMLPGQTVPLHLDVPEFYGIERSACPNWLLVAAHCSGLFSSVRVRNVTSVCYPATRHAGALAVYHPKQGGVHTISCKFHLFRSEEEADQFYSGSGDKLTAESILDGLISNLEMQKKLPSGLSRKSPLHELAPIIVKEFIVPLAPTPSQMEEHWTSSRGAM